MSYETTLVDVADHLGLKKGYYRCSANGRIWSNCKERFLTITPNEYTGYVKVGLVAKDGSMTSLSAHMIVKETFDGPTPIGMVIDHSNRNRTDNRLCNLTFATYSENAINRDQTTASTGNRREIGQYQLTGEFVRTWMGGEEIRQTLGLAPQSVFECCRGEREEVGGFCWEYRFREIEGEVWTRHSSFYVSSHGRVRFPGRHGRVTYGSTSNSGYRKVTHQKVPYSVHTLVYGAFTKGGVPAGMVVNHFNEVRDDNRLVNLMSMTQADNLRYSHSLAVIQLNQTGELVAEFESAVAAEASTKIHRTTIGLACRNNNLSAGGYKWKFKEDRPVSNKVNPNAIPVTQYNLKGEFIANFPSAEEAASTLGCHPNSITQCCSGGHKTGAGFIWRRTSDRPPTSDYTKRFRGGVAQLHPDGRLFKRHVSINAAWQSTGVSASTIKKYMLSGKVYKDFIWKQSDTTRKS